jgi:L-arabinose isomerase
MTAIQPRIGLVPFYLKLYDDIMPERRAGFQPFLDRVVAELMGRGLDVTCAPVCRVAGEFGAALARFENRVDLVITLHLAYSPSLEALDVFRKSRLPLLLLDTTPDAAFGLDVRADRIMLNHGVHGVMDFASMLNRVRRPFEIVAGSVDDPSTFDRAAGMARAAAAVQRFRGMKTLRVGQAFSGMGDFSVDPALLLARFNLSVNEVGMEALDQAAAAVTDGEVDQEIRRDRQRFDCCLD